MHLKDNKIVRWYRDFKRLPWHLQFFALYIFFFVLWGTAISYTTYRLVTRDAAYWREVAKPFTQGNIIMPATRGAILACDGSILSATVPQYRLYLNYQVLGTSERDVQRIQALRDSIYENCFDSIVAGLDSIFPDHDARWFRDRLNQGKARHLHRVATMDVPGSCPYMIYDKPASHIQYMACLKLPLFREDLGISGFQADEQMTRLRPYGGLASRTVGSLFPESEDPKCGLELTYDSILRGAPGYAHRIKVRNTHVKIVDQEPIHGSDLLTSIDINIQDAADKFLREKLKEETVNGEIGIAIVMEVATGDVKAIVNLMRGQDGEYYEMKNHAVSDLMEPGSTFKTASMMVAIDDGYVTENTVVDCMGGQYMMHGRNMKDHNWVRGGYGTLSVSGILEESSNIGVSRIIDQYYSANPEKFVEGLNREGVGLPLDLPFVGKGEPLIPSPLSETRYWSKTDLPWMSIGYVTQLPPISTLTFYNAIANGGRMVRPRFVRAEMQKGKVVREYPVEVIKEQICKPSTLRQIQNCLEHVVSKGLGKKAGNGGKLFPVSGKTGTAQFAVNGSYASRRYMVSFCGYFPSDAPKYSCIVCIVKTGLPASGGGQCGPVFSQISQFIMGQGNYRDSNEIEPLEEGSQRKPRIAKSSAQLTAGRMPDVRGMGAKDAVFALQRVGLRVQLHGTGVVTAQSISPDTEIEKGQSVKITLQQKQKS